MRGDWDQDALNAALDLIERTGAKQVEIGYTREDVPVDQAGWYAHAQYHGARVTVENYAGPIDAAEALARRLLDGAVCVFCTRKIALSDFPGRRCRYTRSADRWVRGCETTHSERDPKLLQAGRRQARGPKRGNK